MGLGNIPPISPFITVLQSLLSIPTAHSLALACRAHNGQGKERHGKRSFLSELSDAFHQRMFCSLRGMEPSCRVPTLVPASIPFVPAALLGLLAPLPRSLCPAVCPTMRPTSSLLLGHRAPSCTSGHPLMTSGSSQPRAGPWGTLLSTWDQDKGWRMRRMRRRLKVEG